MIFLFFASLICALLAGLRIMGVAHRHARRYGVNKPQRSHTGEVPRLGGIAIFLGTLLGWICAGLAFHYHNKGHFYVGFQDICIWSTIVLPAFLGGVLEDFTQRLRVSIRLILTSISAMLAIFLLNVALTRLGIPWLDTMLVHMPWTGVAIALFAITGLPHAFNIIDGYNGLASMVALIIFSALIYVALQVGDRQLASILLCAAGATAGFLFWNYPRGMLFAGDGGAYLWGTIIAVASLLLVQRHSEVSPWFPVLLLIYPIWETFFSIYRKLARGGSPSVADALHIHQLIFRRIVRSVFDDDDTQRLLARNNRTSPYLWSFTLLTVVPAAIFWRNSWILIALSVAFVLLYVFAYLTIIRFKVPHWLKH